MLEQEDIERAAVVFEALGNPARLRMLHILANSDRPLHIRAMSRLIKTRYNAAYKHVRKLRNAGLINVFEVGRSRVLTLREPQLLDRMLELVKTPTKR